MDYVNEKCQYLPCVIFEAIFDFFFSACSSLLVKVIFMKIVVMKVVYIMFVFSGVAMMK